MAEPPYKRFRFDAQNRAAAGSSASGLPTTRSSTAAIPALNGTSGEVTSNNNRNAETTATLDDSWGDDFVMTVELEQQLQAVETSYSQNVSKVGDLHRSSSHPMQQQIQVQQHPPVPRYPQQPIRATGSPTIRRSISNQASTSSFSVAAVGSANPRLGNTQSATQVYNFMRRPAAPVIRQPSNNSTITFSQQQKSPADAVSELRDRLHTVMGERVALTDALEEIKASLAKERTAREVAEQSVKRLEAERSFSAKEVENLVSENQSLSIRLRKRDEQQQQQIQMQPQVQLTDRDVIPPTQIPWQQPQQMQQQHQPYGQFPSMASFSSRSPVSVSGPSGLNPRAPRTPMRSMQPPPAPPSRPPPPNLSDSPSSASSGSTEDIEADYYNESAVASLATATGPTADNPNAEESDAWPVMAKQPDSISCHRRRAELLALYPSILIQCTHEERAVGCLNRPQPCQNSAMAPSNLLDDLPAAVWPQDARREVSNALDCLAKLTSRELELPPSTVLSSTDGAGFESRGPDEAERLLAPIRVRLSGYLMMLRLRPSDPTGILSMTMAIGETDQTGQSGWNDAERTPLQLSALQLSQLGFDAVHQLLRLCQMSSEATLSFMGLRNTGVPEAAGINDAFDLVRLLPYYSDSSTCDREALHCCMRLLQFLLLQLPVNRRHQIEEFFWTGLNVEARRRLLSLPHRPTVTVYIKILSLVHWRPEGYSILAMHDDNCRISELAQCIELDSKSYTTRDLFALIDALCCLVRDCVTLEATHKAATGVTLLNRNCREKCFYKLICSLSNALAQLMPLAYSGSWEVDRDLVSSIHCYIRAMDSLKDYLDVQSCKEMVRQDKTHFFLMGVVDSFKEMAITNSYQEEEYTPRSRTTVDDNAYPIKEY